MICEKLIRAIRNSDKAAGLAFNVSKSVNYHQHVILSTPMQMMKKFAFRSRWCEIENMGKYGCGSGWCKLAIVSIFTEGRSDGNDLPLVHKTLGWGLD